MTETQDERGPGMSETQDDRGPGMTEAAGVACPSCNYRQESAGANFCSQCGAALRGPPCPDCGAGSEPGNRFCTQCGVPLGERAAGPRAGRAARAGAAGGGGLGSAAVAWSLTGAVALVAIVILVVGRGGREITMSPPPAAGGAQGTTALGPTNAVDLNSMTPRQAASRLFTRVMSAVESGDRSQADMFLPMAIASYDLIGDINLDDRFHLSLLHATAGDGVSALAVAEEGLALRPTHLLCLAAAAEAALLLGDNARATAYYQTLVDVYGDEIGAGLEEYGTGETGHASLLPELRDEAAAFLAGTR